jgi:MarR family transcriptional regulator, organic hydroperoxide resistance regulator
MTANPQFSAVLREWAEIFIRRSMRDLFHFIKTNGLSVSQLNTLMRLYYGGSCGVSDISDHLGVTNAATSQMVQRLVEQGFLHRTEDPSDRRVKQLALTDKGRALVGQMIEARHHWLEELTTTLTPEQQAKIITVLADLTEATRQSDPILSSARRVR